MAMSFQYSDKRDALVDFIIEAYSGYDEVTNEDIENLENVRYKGIDVINKVANEIRVKRDLIQGFVLFSNPTDALIAIGEDSNKCSSYFYGHIFNQIYMQGTE